MTVPSPEVRFIWQRELIGVACMLCVAAIVGVLVGRVMPCLLIAVCGYLLVQWIYAYQLYRWLASDRIEPSTGIGVWQEIYTELYRLKQRNRRRKRRLESIVGEFQASTAALPDGVVVLDALGRIVWFNTAAAALLELRSPADRGQRLVNLIRYPYFSGFLARRGAANEELEIPSPADERRTLLMRLVPYGDDQRLLIARDVSHQKRLEATRRDFVANASHELRTPLTVLRGYLEMMAEEADDPTSPLAEWRAPLTEMNGQAQRMNRIIESLLHLARVEADGAQRRQETIDVPRLLASLAEGTRQTDGREHAFEFEIDPELMLLGRPSEIESVLSNLLSNAARYTPDGGTIRVAWGRDEQGVYYAVGDTGPGIEARHIPRLTERFYRADSGRKSTSGGTGLGLAIVKHCLENHEARLLIDSTPGQGSTFTCRFPSRRALGHEAA